MFFRCLPHEGTQLWFSEENSVRCRARKRCGVTRIVSSNEKAIKINMNCMSQLSQLIGQVKFQDGSLLTHFRNLKWARSQLRNVWLAGPMLDSPNSSPSTYTSPRSFRSLCSYWEKKMYHCHLIQYFSIPF